MDNIRRTVANGAHKRVISICNFKNKEDNMHYFEEVIHFFFH